MWNSFSLLDSYISPASTFTLDIDLTRFSRSIRPMRENVIENAKNAHVHGRATKIIEKVLYAHERKTSSGRTKWIMHNCNICLNADNEEYLRTDRGNVIRRSVRGLFDRRNPRDSSCVCESSRAKSRDDTMFCDRDRHPVHDDVACDN